MNAIIVSALLGVVMMFSGILLKNKSSLKYIAIGGLLLLLIANLFQTYGVYTVVVNSHELLRFQKFGLFFKIYSYGDRTNFIQRNRNSGRTCSCNLYNSSS